MFGIAEVERVNVVVAKTCSAKVTSEAPPAAIAGPIDGNLHALQVRQLLETSALHMLECDKTFIHPVAGPSGGLVGHDPKLDAAFVGVGEAHSNGAAARVELPGGHGGRHLRSRAKWRGAEVDSLLAIPALLHAEKETNIAGCIGYAHPKLNQRLGDGGHGKRGRGGAFQQAASRDPLAASAHHVPPALHGSPAG